MPTAWLVANGTLNVTRHGNKAEILGLGCAAQMRQRPWANAELFFRQIEAVSRRCLFSLLSNAILT